MPLPLPHTALPPCSREPAGPLPGNPGSRPHGAQASPSEPAVAPRRPGGETRGVRARPESGPQAAARPGRSGGFGAKREAALRRPRPVLPVAAAAAALRGAWRATRLTGRPRPCPGAGAGGSWLGGAAGPAPGPRAGGQGEGGGAEPPPGLFFPVRTESGTVSPRRTLCRSLPLSPAAAAAQLYSPCGRRWRKRASRAAGGKGRRGLARKRRDRGGASPSPCSR